MTNESQVHEHAPEEKAELFSAHSGGSTEFEYLELLASLVRVWKPEMVLETGTLSGWGAKAISGALKQNDRGYLISIDDAAHNIAEAEQTVNDTFRVSFVCANSVEYIRRSDCRVFDMAFLDSDLSCRVQELDELLTRKLLVPGAIVCIHDTSPARRWGGAPDPSTHRFYEDFRAVCTKHHIKNIINLPLSRGMIVLQIPTGDTQ